MSDEQTNIYASARNLGGGQEAQPDAGARESTWAGPLTPASVWPGASRANLLLIVLSLAGAGCIYFLIPRDSPQKASGSQKLAEVQVDSALSNLAKPNAAHTKAMEVVDTFYYQAKQRQIPLKELGTNPFVFKAPERPKPIVVLEPKEPPKETKKAPPQEMEEVKKLVLQSVLTGSHEPVAMISNNLLTEGQKISGWTLTKIEPRSVTLTWQDKTYILRMSQ